ncbi:MAG: DUF393 domain-containing protein [Porticoccaceae bacterium]|nr:DUF393 domain-containing protein [Porticoccaceae bacterium]
MAELTIFFDGSCPLCATEMTHLRRCDLTGAIAFEDIYADDFSHRFPDIDRQNADRILHGQLASGELVFGLDVTYRAWSLVGKRHWVAVLRWPLVRPVADAVYLFFARHRQRISRLLMGSKRSASCEWQSGR